MVPPDGAGKAPTLRVAWDNPCQQCRYARVTHSALRVLALPFMGSGTTLIAAETPARIFSGSNSVEPPA